MDLSALVLLTTVAGYGDSAGGFPSHEERVLHLWTNAARVAPDEFEDEYQAGSSPCSFDGFLPDEQTPKDPLYIDLALTEVSRLHSADMLENGCFQHESCDGTDTWTRIAEYYTDTGNLGENIAMGTTDPRFAVMGMWMCSSGHRANILSGAFNELGPGVAGNYLTQDFGAGTLALGAPPVRMAVDEGGVYYADFGDSAPPAGLQLVMEGSPVDMDLTHGAAERGIYTAEAPEVAEECRGWYIWWQTAAGLSGTFPEDGSWLEGSCDGADWIGEQSLRGGLFGETPPGELKDAMRSDLTLVGCSTAGAGGFGAVLLSVLIASRRRRTAGNSGP